MCCAWLLAKAPLPLMLCMIREQEAFRKVDFGYNHTIAELCKAAAIPYYSLVSSEGADASSWFLYMKTKGRLEEAVKAMAFPRLTIYRPGLLNRGTKKRTVEAIGMWFVNAVRVRDVGKAMVYQAEADAAAKAVGFQLVGGNATIQAIAKQLVDNVPPAAAGAASAPGTASSAPAPAPAPNAAATGGADAAEPQAKM